MLTVGDAITGHRYWSATAGEHQAVEIPVGIIRHMSWRSLRRYVMATYGNG